MRPFRLSNISPFREIDYFQLKEALNHYANPHAKIRQLLAKHALTRVKKGLYIVNDTHHSAPISSEILANLIYGPSAISLDYALSYYGLIPERVQTLTCITPQRDKLFHTPAGTFSYRYLALKKYQLGLTRVRIDQQRHAIFACPEKALLDKVYFDKTPHLNNSQAIADYLFADLRLAEHLLQKFDLTLLTTLSNTYHKTRTTQVATYLREHVV